MMDGNGFNWFGMDYSSITMWLFWGGLIILGNGGLVACKYQLDA